jgi:hypothetical protein
MTNKKFKLLDKNRRYSKYLILLFILFLFSILKINEEKYKKKNFFFDLKLCLCTLGKNENKYIREFVEYYKLYGADKIYLYDNNDIQGERFEEVIEDYIKENYVEIVDFRGIHFALIKIMNDCYQKNLYKYDWLIFYEIDEFIFLKNYTNIKYFLNQSKFNDCQKIQLNWVHRSDNNLIHYDERPVVKRFTQIGKNVKKNKLNYLGYVKSIIRGNISINITNNHILNKQIKGCDGEGRKIKYNSILNNNPDYEKYYINHYYSKSLEEFVNKLKRGDAQRGVNKENNYYQIGKYFYINEITPQKIDYLEKHLGIDLKKSN